MELQTALQVVDERRHFSGAEIAQLENTAVLIFSSRLSLFIDEQKWCTCFQIGNGADGPAYFIILSLSVLVVY